MLFLWLEKKKAGKNQVPQGKKRERVLPLFQWELWEPKDPKISGTSEDSDL